MGGIYSSPDHPNISNNNSASPDNVSNNGSASPDNIGSSVPPASEDVDSSPPTSDSNTNTNAFAAVAFVAPSDSSTPSPSAPPLRRSSSEIFLEDTISANSVVVFSKSTCGACVKAKSVFDDLGVSYETVELDARPDCAELQDNLLRMTGARTVPRVYVGGDCIGGGSDTVSMFQQGSLQKLLKLKNIDCPRCEAR